MSTLKLRSYDLTTLDVVKAYLKIGAQDKDQDDLLILMIMAATDFVEGQLVNVDEMNGGYCNRRFAATAYTSAKYTGQGFRDLFMRQYPINSITTIVIDDTTEFPSGSDTLADLGFYIDTDAAGNIINTGIWPSGDPQNIVITYNAGHAVIPSDLQLAAIALVSLRWLKKGTEPYKSEKIGNYSYTLQDVMEDNPFGDGMIKDMLDRYRKPIL